MAADLVLRNLRNFDVRTAGGHDGRSSVGRSTPLLSEDFRDVERRRLPPTSEGVWVGLCIPGRLPRLRQCSRAVVR